MWFKSESRNDLYKIVIDAINLSAIGISSEGIIFYANKHFCKMRDISMDKIIGSSIYSYLPQEQYERFKQLLTDKKTVKDLEFSLLSADGTSNTAYFAELNFNFDIEQEGFCFTILNVAPTKIIGKYVNKDDIFSAIQKNIQKTLQESLDIKYTVPKVLEIICKSLEWDAGEIWILNESQKILYCQGLWYDEENVKFKAFKKITHEFLLDINQTFVGKVMKSQSPLWLDDFPKQLPPEVVGIEDELKGALGFPIVYKEKIIGIAIFFSRKSEKPDQDIIDMLERSISWMAESLMQKISFEKFEYISQHDSVTGVLNRPAFVKKLTEALEDPLNKQVIVMMLSLDRFGMVNDAIGHNAGNILLQITTEKLKEILPDEEDIIGRLSIHHFGVILRNVKEVTKVIDYANKLLVIVKQPIFINRQEIFITASIGISVCPKDGNNAETLLMSADAALVQAEEKGSNCFEFNSPDISRLLTERFEIANLLHHAVEENQFELFYQPKVDLKAGEIVGLEALLRWKDPIKGFRLPGEFLSVAEETDLIIPIGEWVLREACKHIQKGEFGVPIAVNLSMRQFKKQCDLTGYILKLIDEYKINAQHLELEITEGILMNDSERIYEVLAPLKKIGIQFSIDDFGTGYSSFRYLQNFLPDRIKIDKSFIDYIPHNVNTTKVVKGMLVLGKILGIKTIAEGVETVEQLKTLINEGCDEIQGYYFSKPVPLDEAKRLLKDNVKLKLP